VLFRAGKLERARAARRELMDVVANAKPNRRNARFATPHRESLPRQPKIKGVPTIADAYVESLER